MALLTLTEAAMKTGWSIELLESLMMAGPKHGEKERRLACKTLDGERLVDDKVLDQYVNYLGQPWPLSPKAKRPHIPKVVANDIRAECHHECAVCGRQDSGEIAHLEPVASSRNNSPDNLILLCPNHHSKFDDSYCLANNLTIEVAREAKSFKRSARRRMLRHEDNSRRAMAAVMARVEGLRAKLNEATDPTQALAVNTEIRSALKGLPATFEAARKASENQQTYGSGTDLLTSPALARAVEATKAGEIEDTRLAGVVADLVSAASEYRMPDEIHCPHCNGSGQTGLVGDLCAYCQGSCVVSAEKAEGYDPTDIDEVECPHCNGSGQTGLVGDVCAYCQGSCVVSAEKAEGYDPTDIDEVECPHCNGSGQTGLVGDVCAYCQGSCVVSAEKAEWYGRRRGAMRDH